MRLVPRPRTFHQTAWKALPELPAPADGNIQSLSELGDHSCLGLWPCYHKMGLSVTLKHPRVPYYLISATAGAPTVTSSPRSGPVQTPVTLLAFTFIHRVY